MAVEGRVEIGDLFIVPEIPIISEKCVGAIVGTLMKSPTSSKLFLKYFVTKVGTQSLFFVINSSPTHSKYSKDHLPTSGHFRRKNTAGGGYEWWWRWGEICVKYLYLTAHLMPPYQV